MNLLGIDWGEKRIGLSFADPLKFAMPIPAAIQSNVKDRMNYIDQVIKVRKIEALVVGYPLNMNGSVGFKAEEVDRFIEKLKRRFHLPIYKVDERLTSHSVEQDLKAMNKKVDPKSGEIDSRAATLILQDFLDQKVSQSS